MKVRRCKPYVCVDCDYADHFRFQDTKDLDAAAGTWLRCLAHSRAQEQDGVVKVAWLRRTFATCFERVDELIAVGLLRARDDGDYELHAYAPRNQTLAMLEEDRASARERMAATRREQRAIREGNGSPEQAVRKRRASSNKTTEQGANERRTSTLVPTSLSTSSSFSSDTEREGEVQEGGTDGSGAPRVTSSRPPLPASERALSGPFWLVAFTDGITAHTGRACTAGRVYLGTLERLVSHHAPKREVSSACDWLRSEARAFAAQWDGKHPAKGLTPDGLERWLNDGRPGPPEFGRLRIVQPSAEQWHEDDWSDLGAEVVR